MYKPVYKTGKNAVPILTKREIDIIAENFLLDFCPTAMKTPMEIDIESFAQNYLGLKQDFQYLSHNGIYLGMIVFNDTDRIPVYIPETNTAEYISAEARTIIIDNNLLQNNQEHRYRYTMGHECGHDIFHTGYFSYDPYQISHEPMIKCRTLILKDNKKPVCLWDDKDRMEWQANYLSSAILMPKTMICKAVDGLDQLMGVLCDDIYILKISKIFNVSEEAARYRINGLRGTGNIS